MNGIVSDAAEMAMVNGGSPILMGKPRPDEKIIKVMSVPADRYGRLVE